MILKQSPQEIKNEYQYYIWKPKGLRIWPKGFINYLKEMRKYPIINMVYWWLFYYVLKRNSDYSIVIIKKDEDVAHYSVILPKNYRFPFAQNNDLIIGPVWTNPNYRKKGLVYFSLSVIFEKFSTATRQFWWICNEKNIASQISIEKAGFKLYGKGKINNNWLKIFSYFTVENNRDYLSKINEEVKDDHG